MVQQSQSSIPDFDIKKGSRLFYRDNLKLYRDNKSLWVCYFSGVVVYLIFIGLLINYFYKNAYFDYLLANNWGMALSLVLIYFASYVYLLINTLTTAYIIQYTLIKVHAEGIKPNIFLDTIKKLIMHIDDLIIYSFIRPYFIDLWLLTRIISPTLDIDTANVIKTYNYYPSLSNLIGNLSICFILNENLNSQQAIKHVRSQMKIFLTSYLFQLKTMNRSIIWSLVGFLPFLIIMSLMYEFPHYFHDPYVWFYLMIIGFIIAILWNILVSVFYTPVEIMGDTIFYLFLFKNTVPKHCSKELAEIISFIIEKRSNKEEYSS